MSSNVTQHDEQTQDQTDSNSQSLIIDDDDSNNQLPPSAIPSKVIIVLKAVGNAKILKQNKCAISSQKSYSEVLRFLRRRLDLPTHESLLTYVNQAFCPNPDENIGNLFMNFGVEKMLIVNYSTQPVWG